MEEELAAIDKAVREWRQGDFVRGSEVPFIHVADAARPLTQAAADLAAEEGSADWLMTVPVSEPGLVVVSQTCDLIRGSAARPFVELSPLIELDTVSLQQARRGERPRFATMPGLDDTHYAVDLDRVMTIEKAVLARIPPGSRSVGCPDDASAAHFAAALSRKRARAAFPDDFNHAVSEIQRRIQKKHGKNTDEGRFFDRCREIRARSRPSWLDPQDVELWFIFDSDEEAMGGDGFLDSLQKLFRATGDFSEIEIKATSLDSMTAKLYLESQRLELDHLTISEGPPPVL